MKYLIAILITIVIGLASFFGGIAWSNRPKAPMPTPTPTPVPTPLAKYSIEALSTANITAGKFQITDTLEDNDNFTVYKFKLTFDPEINSGKYKTTTGQINIPKAEGTFPLIVMFRGYVDQTLYTTGIGTRSAAAVFAKEGFITVAPDFLGYAESDTEAGNIFESRFQTYTTAISLIKTLEQINKWNQEDAFIWAHSNGGQIALTVLEATGIEYPTSLWAPVTKPFPYSVLYYTDESADRGKFIRRELAKFEEIYNADKFAITDYLDRVKAPLQLHQGTNDDAIPVEWSREIVKRLQSHNVEVEYFEYPGADHNLRPSWDVVVQKDIEFYKKHL